MPCGEVCRRWFVDGAWSWCASCLIPVGGCRHGAVDMGPYRLQQPVVTYCAHSTAYTPGGRVAYAVRYGTESVVVRQDFAGKGQTTHAKPAYAVFELAADLGDALPGAGTQAHTDGLREHTHALRNSVRDWGGLVAYRNCWYRYVVSSCVPCLPWGCFRRMCVSCLYTCSADVSWSLGEHLSWDRT